MIVDNKGDIFENRRKANSDRRKGKVKTENERRKEERRNTPSGERKSRRRK